MARRFGSAMISNTDSKFFIYSNKYIPVKKYILASVEESRQHDKDVRYYQSAEDVRTMNTGQNRESVE
jgi:hypothetical protein